MKTSRNTSRIKFNLAIVSFIFFVLNSALSFEGYITATFVRSGGTQTWHYPASAPALRIGGCEANGSRVKKIMALGAGLILPVSRHNCSFMRLKPVTRNPSSTPTIPAPPPDYHEIQRLPF
jgi:hypothetical protein